MAFEILLGRSLARFQPVCEEEKCSKTSADVPACYPPHTLTPPPQALQLAALNGREEAGGGEVGMVWEGAAAARTSETIRIPVGGLGGWERLQCADTPGHGPPSGEMAKKKNKEKKKSNRGSRKKKTQKEGKEGMTILCNFRVLSVRTAKQIALLWK